MKLSRRLQSGTAFTLALAMTASTALSISLARSVAAAEPYRIAQVFPPSWRNDRPSRGTPGTLPNQWNSSVLPAGTIIPTSYEKDKIVVTPTETSDLTLDVPEDIRSPRGVVIIPAGSQIKGQLRPASDGTQFVAEELILDNGDRYDISATSEVINRREVITRRSNPRWFEGVAIGAVAASVLGELFGEIELWQVLGGAGIGALGSLLIRNRQEVEVIVIDSATDLSLELQSSFALNQRSVSR